MTNPIDIASNNINKLRILQKKSQFDHEEDSVGMITPTDTSTSYITKEITDYLLTDEIEAGNSLSTNNSFSPSNMQSTNYPSQLKSNILHNSHNSSPFMHNNLSSYCQHHQFLNHHRQGLASSLPSGNLTMSHREMTMMNDDDISSSSIKESTFTSHHGGDHHYFSGSVSSSSNASGSNNSSSSRSISSNIASIINSNSTMTIVNASQSLESLLEKQRKRKENHNAVERRRRDHINEMIQKLSCVIEATMFAEGETILNSMIESNPSSSSSSALPLFHASLNSSSSNNNNNSINGINGINGNNNVNIMAEDNIRLNKGDVLERSIKLIMNMKKVIKALMTLKSNDNDNYYWPDFLSKYEDVSNFLSHESFVIQDK